MNFENDIRRHVLTHLPHEVADTPTLAAKGIGDLLSIYFNWLHRLVPARPRQIHRSRSLLANPLAADPVHRQGLDQLIEKIENGTDIAPHLSRGILCGFKPKDPTKPKALLKRPDLDLLLNDWGIHHLHISTKLDKDGFVERRPSHPPRPLLFGIFRPDAAYLIDLMQHGDWTHTHLLEGCGEGMARRGTRARAKGDSPKFSTVLERGSQAAPQRRHFCPIGERWQSRRSNRLHVARGNFDPNQIRGQPDFRVAKTIPGSAYRESRLCSRSVEAARPADTLQSRSSFHVF